MDNFYIELVICFILLAFLIGLVINILLRKILNNYLDEINKTIKLLQDDININLNYKSQELNKFYDAISQLQKKIKTDRKNHDAILKILNSVVNNIELNKFLEDFMPKILDVTESLCAAFYLYNEFHNQLEIKYSIGFDKNIYKEFDLDAHEIFLENNFDVKIINNIPNDSIYLIKSFMGKLKPKSIMIIPVENKNKLNGILILASLYNYTQEQIEIINLTREYINIAIKNGIIFEKSERLINELKFQNKLIQDWNNELEKKIKRKDKN